MPSRKIPLVNGEIYHVYNRGVEKRRIAEGSWDYRRLLKTLKYYQFKGPKPKFSTYLTRRKTKFENNHKIVEIIAFCIMPNHFHILLKQLEDGGITEFLSKVSNSYTKFFNTKYKRVGPLLQGEFKAVHIENDEQLIHISRYIHLNPVAAFLVRNLSEYQWSSYQVFVSQTQDNLCTPNEVLSFFKTPIKYEEFVQDQAGYSQTLALIKHNTLE